MGFFKSTCVRCGSKRTRQNVDGLPTCKRCELKLQMKREDTRACPIDGSAMQKRITHNVIVDKCPNCQGVWLDQGELNLGAEAVRRERSGDFASGFITGMIIG